MMKSCCYIYIIISLYYLTIFFPYDHIFLFRRVFHKNVFQIRADKEKEGRPEIRDNTASEVLILILENLFSVIVSY